MNQIIHNVIPIIVLVIIILSIYMMLNIKINHKQYQAKDLMIIFYIIYFIFLIYTVTCDNLLTYQPENNFEPFQELMRYKIKSKLFIKNIIGNIFLFIPFGHFFQKQFHLNYKYIAVITFIYSLSIELTQLLIGRVFDIDDIILNIIGAIAGSILVEFKFRIC